MKSQALSRLNMPDLPGVYIFRDARKHPLYIGRATSLKDRTKSYFSDDLIVTRGPRIIDMVTKAKSLTWQETDSVLEAIILESLLIKRYQPRYNVDERDDKSDQYVIITDEAWPRVFLARVRDFDAAVKENRLPFKVKARFGPFVHAGLIKEALKILRKLFPFRDRKAHDPRHEAFYRSLGRSPESDDANAKRRYRRTISNLILFFEGKKAALRAKLERDMKASAKKMEFEEAGRVKKLLYALDHVNDMALIKEERGVSAQQAIQQDRAKRVPAEARKEKGVRIEAYDIAHLSGTNVVGAMAVFVNGESVPAEYRKFKLSRQVNDDIAGLVEILSRRLNHSEWAYPDLIVVDGNRNQLKAAEVVLKARHITIPIVAVTKDERHKAVAIIGDGDPIGSDMIGRHSKAIIAVNAEAHRFAIAFHRRRRNIGITNGQTP